MADILLTTLEEEVRDFLQDADGTQWLDREIVAAVNDSIEFLIVELYRQKVYSMIDELHCRTWLDDAEFSYSDEINLPIDYVKHIMMKRYGYTLPLRVAGVQEIDDTTTENRGMVRAASVGAPTPDSSNSGTDTLEADGDYSGSADEIITITVDAGGATFSWTSSVSGSGSAVAMATTWTTLQNGIKVKWGDTSGFTAGDIWTVKGYITQKIHILTLNYAPEEDIELWYIRRPVRFTVSGGAIVSTDRLPFRRYYLPIKEYVITVLMNRNEEDVRQNMSLMAPITRMILNISSSINSDDDAKLSIMYPSSSML